MQARYFSARLSFSFRNEEFLKWAIKSFNEVATAIGNAMNERGIYAFIVEFYSDHVIVSENGKLFKVLYSMNKDLTASIQDRKEWSEVRVSYIESFMNLMKSMLNNGQGETEPEKGANMTQEFTLAAALESDEAKAKIEELAAGRVEELAQQLAEEIASARIKDAELKQHVANFSKEIVGSGIPLVESDISD